MAIFLAFLSGFLVGLFMFFAIGGLLVGSGVEAERRRVQAQADADAAWVRGAGRSDPIYRASVKADFDKDANRDAGAYYRRK